GICCQRSKILKSGTALTQQPVVVWMILKQRNSNSMERMTAFVKGNVQGVGFRWWTRSRALELGLAGHATNKSDGRVQVVAEHQPSRSCRSCSRTMGCAKRRVRIY